MPRILSRHDLVPQTKQNYYGYSYSGSSSTTGSSRSATSYSHSPTMSTVSSVDTKAKLSSNRYYEGLSYRIEDRQPHELYQSRSDADEAKALSDDTTWGYFVDFTSPVTKNDTKGRKSLASYLNERSSSSF
jgi:hypothetical protein